MTRASGRDFLLQKLLLIYKKAILDKAGISSTTDRKRGVPLLWSLIISQEFGVTGHSLKLNIRQSTPKDVGEKMEPF